MPPLHCRLPYIMITWNVFLEYQRHYLGIIIFIQHSGMNIDIWSNDDHTKMTNSRMFSSKENTSLVSLVLLYVASTFDGLLLHKFSWQQRPHNFYRSTKLTRNEPSPWKSPTTTTPMQPQASPRLKVPHLPPRSPRRAHFAMCRWRSGPELNRVDLSTTIASGGRCRIWRRLLVAWIMEAAKLLTPRGKYLVVPIVLPSVKKLDLVHIPVNY